MAPVRARKLGERIAQIVAEMLEKRIKDPRLGFVTVTEARVTGDLREATVFYTVYGSAHEHAATAAALASATGLIRSEVGRQTGLKHTPSIAFQLDSVPDNARNIEDLVARAREADAAVAAAREGAEPAGDPDPYKVAAEPGGEDDDPDEADDDPDAGLAGRPGSGLDAGFAGSPDGGLDAGRAGGLDGDLDRIPRAGPAGLRDLLGETPAGRDRGAGYSRS